MAPYNFISKSCNKINHMLLHTPLTPHIWNLPYISNFFPPFLPHLIYTTTSSTEHIHNPNINNDICIISCPHHCTSTFKNTTFYTPHWRETFIYLIVIRRRSQPLWTKNFNRRITSPRKSTNGIFPTNIHEPTFHWGTTPIPRINVRPTSCWGEILDFHIFFNGGISYYREPTFI
jgi:hypothetical protein